LGAIKTVRIIEELMEIWLNEVCDIFRVKKELNGVLVSFCYTTYTFFYLSLFILQVPISPGFDSSPCHISLVMVEVTYNKEVSGKEVNQKEEGQHWKQSRRKKKSSRKIQE